MKLLKLSYCDRRSGWSIDSCEFFPEINLLVGISGAGKTSILSAIYNLKEIANGKSLNGIKWDVRLLIDESVYCWKGEFEIGKIDSALGFIDFKRGFKIVNEYIYLNNKEIIKRENDEIWLNTEKTPKLDYFLSVISLLSSESEISPLKTELNKIDVSFKEYISRIESPITIYSFVDGDDTINHEKDTLESIRNANLELIDKLLFVSMHKSSYFQKLKQSFINIFPRVEDLDLEVVTESGSKLKKIQIKLKEKHLNSWISEKNISSGMLKSLIFLGLIELSPDGSVILIDEFENSLGVNCLDSLTEILSDISRNRDLQFIITSHHPYIINNISPSYWKIITRKDGVITANNAENYHISKSRHKAFIELINVLKDFPEGLDEE